MSKTYDSSRTSPDWQARCAVARSDIEAGRDIAWARADADFPVRICAARADAEAGCDLAWARRDPASAVRRIAAESDVEAGRDIAWARKDDYSFVRIIAARADIDAGRDLTWAKNDAEPHVRRTARAGTAVSKTSVSKTDDLFRLRDELEAHARALMVAKNAAYTDPTDPIGNYRHAARVMGVSPALAILGRLAEQTWRLRNLVQSGALTDAEAVKSCEDLVNFPALILYAWREGSVTQIGRNAESPALPARTAKNICCGGS